MLGRYFTGHSATLCGMVDAFDFSSKRLAPAHGVRAQRRWSGTCRRCRRSMRSVGCHASSTPIAEPGAGRGHSVRPSALPCLALIPRDPGAPRSVPSLAVAGCTSVEPFRGCISSDLHNQSSASRPRPPERLEFESCGRSGYDRVDPIAPLNARVRQLPPISARRALPYQPASIPKIVCSPPKAGLTTDISAVAECTA